MRIWSLTRLDCITQRLTHYHTLACVWVCVCACLLACVCGFAHVHTWCSTLVYVHIILICGVCLYSLFSICGLAQGVLQTVQLIGILFVHYREFINRLLTRFVSTTHKPVCTNHRQCSKGYRILVQDVVHWMQLTNSLVPWQPKSPLTGNASKIIQPYISNTMSLLASLV